MLSLLLVLLMNVAWATTITVQLRDSDGNAVPNPESARLKYYSGGWQDAAENDGSGNFLVDESLLPRTLKMCYNSGEENRFIDGTTDPVVFNTVTFTAMVEDADGNELTMPQPRFNHRMTTWHSSTIANTWVELMPGTYHVKMTYHTGQIEHLVNIVNDNHREVFVTTTVTPKLVDCNNNLVDVTGTNWRLTHGCVGPCLGCVLNQPMELLSGSQVAFHFSYGNERIDEIGNYPPLPASDPNYNPWVVPSTPTDIIFTAPGIAEAFVWEDANGNGFYDMGESGLGGIQVDIEKPNGTFLMTATTNSGGIASFFDYPWDIPIKMHVYIPADMKPTKSKGPKTNPDNSDIDKNGLTPAFSGGSCASFIDWIGAGFVNKNAKKMASTTPKFGIYPNPTQSYAVVSYELTTESNVSVIVYDLLGRQVAVVEEGTKPAGEYSIEWYAGTLTPGTYICRFNLGDRVEVERLIISE